MAERPRPILAHVYWNRELFDGEIHPSLRGTMQACALYLLKRRDAIDKIFIAGGYLWGEEYPSFAQVLTYELEDIGVAGPITCVAKATDTSGEIDLFLKEAKKEKWSNLTFLANRDHLRRIDDLLRAKKVKGATLIASEDVLVQYPFFQNFVENFGQSEHEELFKKYNNKVLLAYRLKLGWLLKLASKGRKEKKPPSLFDA